MCSDNQAKITYIVSMLHAKAIASKEILTTKGHPGAIRDVGSPSFKQVLLDQEKGNK